MKVTFPHLGTLAIGLRALLESLGAECVVPPPTTAATIARGAALAPESACLPLKVGLGNFLEAEELGAEAVVMAGGSGPCRLGYYADVQRDILRAAGSRLEFIVLEPPGGHLNELWRRIKRVAPRSTLAGLARAISFAWAKLAAIDELDRLTAAARPYEIVRGEVSALRERCLTRLADAASIAAVRAASREQRDAFAALPRAETGDPPLRCGLVGEVYVVLEPAVNHDVERRLGELGVVVERSVFITDWVVDNLGRDALRLGYPAAHFRRARPYLNHWVGGHGTDNVGAVVQFARAGYDGVVQVAPLTCMPEIVAHSVLQGRVAREEGIPVLTLYFDEHTGEAGTVTRLEAFADLMRRRREAKEGYDGRRLLHGR